MILTTSDDDFTIAITGRVTRADEDELAVAVAQAGERDGDVVFDLRDATLLTSVCFGQLAKTVRMLKQQQRHVRISHISSDLREKMVEFHFDHLFDLPPPT